LQRLNEAVARGDKMFTVTGRVPGWKGRFPVVLDAWAKTPEGQKHRLEVTNFEVEKK
jgi:hypothetical protein